MTPLYKWLSQALGGIQKYTSELVAWKQKKHKIPDEDCVPRTLIDSADEVKARVEEINDEGRQLKSEMASRDMQQLFTNVDQADVLEKLGEELFPAIFDMVLEQKNKDTARTRRNQGRFGGRDSLRLVVHSKHSKLETQIMGVEEIEERGWRECSSRKIITLETLQKWLKDAIEHSYV